MISKSGKDFAIMMEKVNDGFFTHWNNRMRIFREDDTEDILDCSTIDKKLYDRKGRMCNIELKTRDCQINTFDTLFLEEKKWLEFKKDYEEKGFLPIYINFLQDGNHVWLCDLRQFFDGRHKIEKKTVTINNYGYGTQDDNQVRYLIPPRLGVYYELDTSTDKYKRLW